MDRPSESSIIQRQKNSQSPLMSSHVQRANSNLENFERSNLLICSFHIIGSPHFLFSLLKDESWSVEVYPERECIDVKFELENNVLTTS